MRIVFKFSDFLKHLVDSFIDIYLKHFKAIVSSTTVVVLAIIIFLSWSSSKKVREVVLEDFNKQQLVLAQYVASMVESSIRQVKKDLVNLSKSLSAICSNQMFLAKSLQMSFVNLKDLGGVEVRFINTSLKKTFVVSDSAKQYRASTDDELKLLSKMSNIVDKSNLIDIKPIIKDSTNKIILDVAMPVWQGSFFEDEILQSHALQGVIVFSIDTRALIEEVTKAIKSVKDGYVWIIDNTGVFLFHPESDLIGKNAFTARQEKMPHLSFVEINEIQKNSMLKGETGTGFYISGWHKGMQGEIKKLLAYAPIKVSQDGSTVIWSVAVATPVKEVETAIDEIQLQQLILEAFVVVLVLLGGVISMALMFRWSQSLKKEVDKKTRELKKSEYQYKSLIENANDIIFTVNQQGTIMSINKAGQEFFKDTSEEIVGTAIGELCYSEESAYIQLKAIEEVFKTGKSKQITHHITLANKEHWLNTNFTPLIEEDGSIPLILGISRDITMEKKKEKEEQMYQAEKLASMGTLAAGVAHEINNPLAIILGFTDLLLERFSKDSEEYDMLKTMEKQATNAKRVVENLLSFSRYSEYHLEAVDINNSIEAVISIIKNTLKIKDIALKLDFADNLPRVKADAGELQQVFLNILNNAIHAMSKGGTMTISTRLIESNQIEIRFADTGHGIKKEHRSKIFDPLFTTKKVGEGTGLGLSVSYGIVTKYGGTITFETKTIEESEQTGTTFIITLPAIS